MFFYFLCLFELFVILSFGSLFTSALLIFEIASECCKTAKGDGDSLNLLILTFPAASFALSARHVGTRPRGEGNNECKWLNKNRGALNDMELEDALAALPVDSDNCNARKSENESPFKCIKLRETCGSSYVNQGSVGKQPDTVATSDKQTGTLLQYLEQCDTNSSLTARSPIPKRKISDYFAAAPRPK